MCICCDCLRRIDSLNINTRCSSWWWRGLLVAPLGSTLEGQFGHSTCRCSHSLITAPWYYCSSTSSSSSKQSRSVQGFNLSKLLRSVRHTSQLAKINSNKYNWVVVSKKKHIGGATHMGKIDESIFECWSPNDQVVTERGNDSRFNKWSQVS